MITLLITLVVGAPGSSLPAPEAHWVEGPAVVLQEDEPVVQEPAPVEYPPFVGPPVVIPEVPGAALMRFYHSDGSLAREGYVKDGARVGVWKSWFPNGNLESHGAIENYTRVGPWRQISADQKSVTEGHFDNNGQRHGHWRVTYERAPGDVVIKAELNYDHGRRDGLHQRFNKQGNVISHSEFKQDVRHGLTMKYAGGGEYLAEVGQYEMGQQVGPWKYYHPSGVPSSEGSFTNGLRSGEWTEYYVNGKRKSTGSFVQGVPDGAWRGFHKQGERRFVGTFKKGVLEGAYTEWWPSGDRKGEGSYTEGRFDGNWSFWDRNGRLDDTKTGLYRNGDLVR